MVRAGPFRWSRPIVIALPSHARTPLLRTPRPPLLPRLLFPPSGPLQLRLKPPPSHHDANPPQPHHRSPIPPIRRPHPLHPRHHPETPLLPTHHPLLPRRKHHRLPHQHNLPLPIRLERVPVPDR